MISVSEAREKILAKYKNKDFVTDRTGQTTVELVGESILVDEDYIIRPTNEEYFGRELEWYKSQSRKVADMPGPIPKIWQDISSREGLINSNYGWCIFSEENGSQYLNVVSELTRNPDSRRAIMLYNRPSMHTDFNADGMNDFVCTLANHFFIRDEKLVMHVTMRSCDLVFGAGNDWPWFRYVQNKLAQALNIECGDFIFTAGSAHVYERHYKFLDEWMKKDV